MRRPRALQAEVLAGRYEAAAEVHLPDPVDRDPRGQRVVVVDEPARQRAAVSLAVASGSAGGTWACRPTLALHQVAAARPHVGGAAAGHLTHHHDLALAVLDLAERAARGRQRRQLGLAVFALGAQQQVAHVGAGWLHARACEATDLGPGQLAGEHVQLVDRAALEALVAEALRERQRVGAAALDGPRQSRTTDTSARTPST